MKPGIFTLSLDFELIWGTLDKSKWPCFVPLCGIERNCVFPALLKLFDEYAIPATWCVVGHLMLERCDGRHDDRGRPGWFRLDPASSEQSAPWFYGRSLVKRIQACGIRQEIGLHSFSHAIFNECGAEVADAELDASMAAARELGIEPRSFVFPRNAIDHLDRLAAHGIQVYRGESPRWYDHGGYPRLLRRIGHLVDIATVAPPPLVEPRRDRHGLWNVPASMLYTPSFGARCVVPVALRVMRAKAGLRAAAQKGGLFHLWFHPTDLTVRTAAMLNGLRQVLRYAAELRERGQLQIAPMGEVPEVWGGPDAPARHSA